MNPCAEVYDPPGVTAINSLGVAHMLPRLPPGAMMEALAKLEECECSHCKLVGMVRDPAASRAYVEQVAQVLDRRQPGWAQRVDITSLSLTSGMRCIVGQVYGEWDVYVAHRLLNEAGHPHAAVFTLPHFESAWRDAIIQRRHKAARPDRVWVETPATHAVA